MSGKIILNTRQDVHLCKGAPRMLKRIIKNIGPGSQWQCDECQQIWILRHYEGWGYDWDRARIGEIK